MEKSIEVRQITVRIVLSLKIDAYTTMLVRTRCNNVNYQRIRVFFGPLKVNH